jgi:hypothetical protein
MAQQGIGGPPDYHAHGRLLAQRQAEAAERQAEREEAERQADLAAYRDAREAAMYMSGVQPGAQLERASAIADLEAEISGHRQEIEKLERRLSRYQQQGRADAEMLSRAHSMASRSAPSDPADPLAAATSRAHRAFREATRARLAEAEAAVAVRSAGRPKAAGGAGAAERAGQPYSQHQGPMLTRICGPDETGRLANHAPEISR